LNIQTAARPFLTSDIRRWTQILKAYREPNQVRSTMEIAITFAPLAALWALAWAALHFGYWWLSLLLAVPAAGFLVRLFMIQHDCGHGSFFRHRLANDWVGRVIGVITLTPYHFWRRTHAIHHASSGHLERRGMGDVDTSRCTNTIRALSGVVFATGRTGTHSSCSASAPPICLSCGIGFRLVCS
jgi:acyl-lipid omega-6 desaturase (Delta-12 desaturase)